MPLWGNFKSYAIFSVPINYFGKILNLLQQKIAAWQIIIFVNAQILNK